jgi:ribosomal protein S18 acetylase RimI-like enzyme
MMKEKINPNEINIRSELLPGDIGYITYMHGNLYRKEYNYGIAFETYVAAGLIEFYQHYDPAKDCVWVCEHKNKIVGFLLLMHRGKAAQLRYFILEPAYRSIGLGKKLMDLYMECLKKNGYRSCYLLTTHEQSAAAHLYTRYGFRLTEEKESTAFEKLLKEQRYDLIIPE